MSGVVVIVDLDGRPVDAELLERLTDRLAECGPDGRGLWSAGGVGMGHALHRTTDEDAFDSQPATLDGQIRLVSSARIDARRELMDRLGDRSKTPLDQTPDAELILRAFRAWDTRCPSRLLGDFAFAVWDGRERRLFCARDRFGMRQLYYARAGSTLLVSNSLYCLLGHPGISRQLDDEAVGGFLLFGDHTWLDKGITAFAGIRSVPPAHALLLDGGRVVIERYWDFPIEVPLLRYRREEEVVERFSALFAEAVADRCRSASVTIAMSGGMDSSSMAATALRVRASSGVAARVRAMTVLYDSIMPSEERRYAADAAENLGIPIGFFDAGGYGFLEPPVATCRPLELYSPGPWIDLFRAAAECGGVLLHGEGGDSLLSYSAGLATLRGGAPLRIPLELVRMRWCYGAWPRLGTGLLARLRRLTRRGTGICPAEGYPYPSWLDPDFERRLQLRGRWHDFWMGHPRRLNSRHPAMHEGLVGPDWNLQELFLHPGFTMPEIRDPFLDLRLIELVLALPPLPWTFRKHLLRRSMADVLPEPVLRRPKTPLGELHRVLMAQPAAGWVDGWTAGGEIETYVQAMRIPALRGAESSGGEAYVNLRPLLLERWLEATELALANG